MPDDSRSTRFLVIAVLAAQRALADCIEAHGVQRSAP